MATTPVQTSYLDNQPLPYAGLMADTDDSEVYPAYNAEASAQIPFGFAVARYTTAPYDVWGNGVKLPASAADVIMGICRHSHAYSNAPGGDLGATGLNPNAVLNVLRRGRIWAVCEDGCAPGARLWIRYTAAGTGKGTLRSTDAGGSTCLDATTKGEWQTAAAAGAVAMIDVNFVNK